MKDLIIQFIESSSGLKEVELVMKLMTKISPSKFNVNEFYKIVGGMILANEIVRVEYILPNMDYRVKSMYFPKGTKVGIPNKLF